ncbi:hypothetical protein FRACYDRAFT_248147 [Fragilariopsis cylindrus CCMP1102]|uniref:Fascin domain-containing protein n=1 Tax=Fragilariopsis cylindrus CCMP1102 TaxID=635003 RepID=A0A1E7EVK4_9STRA|nr:hypothetical protein FRACYDRAFT_248147 [Fragilariopsis cylindrus CCMP1102]|eukprot:OEU09896.1 hypothetical protein FRACYDRAFT_248147 [Fragilariopsis cylindrus CCMP1102]
MGSEIDNIINNNNNANSNDDLKSSSSSSTTPTPIPPASAFIIKTKARVPPNNTATFPCIEQPLRVILYCNGYYLWSTRNGSLIARKKRAFEKDEWRLKYDTSSNSGVVMIQNHKFNSTLSVVQRGIKNVAMCIKGKEKEKQNTTTKDEGFESNDYGNNRNDENEINDEFNDEEEEGTIMKEDNNSTIPTAAPLDVEVEVEEEDQQWCFIKSTAGKAMIKSLKTGENLSITTDGQIVFISDNDCTTTTTNQTYSSMWDIECVTGELCFISNMANTITANTDNGRRIRCDIAGMISLSSNWKGWEIFRFMECSGSGGDGGGGDGDSGYVKISSWMHSQWILCSDVYGNVTTCTHSESLLSTLSVVVQDNDNDDNDDNENNLDEKKKNYRCSKWAIEKKNNGLIIRSKTYGRLLFITKDGMLRTTTNSNNNNNTNHDDCDNSNNNNGNKISNSVDVDEEEVNEIVNNSNNNNNNKPTTIRRMSSSTRSINNSSSNVNNWWNSSMKNMQNKFNNNNTTTTSTTASTTTTVTTKSVVQERHEEEQEQEETTTILWDLQAAHSQCYYFLSSSVASSPPSSLKVATTATATATATTKSIEKQQYISCSSDGCITATSNSENDGTDWYMEKGSTSTSTTSDQDSGNDCNDDDDGAGAGGSVFKSKAHNYYLSYKEGEGVKIEKATTATGEVEVEGQETTGIMKDDNSNRASSNSNTSSRRSTTTIEGRFKNAFNSMKGENLPLPILIGSKTIMMDDDDDDDEQSNNVHMVWNLEPCMPRAVSSEKIKTFAIGTSIAVGTTIAMPFALAGVAAIMGAVGAEAGIGFGILAVGLSGAEALASVGAIGATAYIVFKPANNSLTDDHKKKKGEEEGEVEEKPWSKRPFSNWRNW